MDPTTMQSDFIERLCHTHEGQLHQYLAQMVGSAEVARELAQDSFAEIYRSYRPEQVQFPRALLFRVATNFALMHLRRRRLGRALPAGEPRNLEPALDEVGHRIGPDGELSGVQLGDHIARAVKALPPNLRYVFVMAHVAGRTRKEIAAAVGTSEKRVDKRMTAALRKCREHLLSLGINLTDIVGLVAVLPVAYILNVN